ncbi:hypothetical protein KL86SPO_70011 [uncultured Sporomusa sp.]|uniref:Uncharacterized protein n=1 Tax=uncultured Sporomusa sp. TaxID=307249 RepID=A0A212M045_9FIRM|nr:hypothetical protein KL86SPO_70011 [uncultured Sporomusa sp.]
MKLHYMKHGFQYFGRATNTLDVLKFKPVLNSAVINMGNEHIRCIEMGLGGTEHCFSLRGQRTH